MRPFLFSCLVGSAALYASVAQGRGDTFLCQPAYQIDEELRGPAEAYTPQPGDLFLSTDSSRIAQAGHRLALSGPPHHSGIFVARPDGRLGILEAGPFNTLHVRIDDPAYCLEKHEERGDKAWIRRRRTPLTPEQSAQLTAWAVEQDGKRFAVLRVLRQVTIFRERGPLRTYFMGEPHGDRNSYYCAELVMETLVNVGLFEACDARPSATYPRDLFFDTSVNLFLNEHQNLSDGWYPPARWTSGPPAP